MDVDTSSLQVDLRPKQVGWFGSRDSSRLALFRIHQVNCVNCAMALPCNDRTINTDLITMSAEGKIMFLPACVCLSVR